MAVDLVNDRFLILCWFTKIVPKGDHYLWGISVMTKYILCLCAVTLFAFGLYTGTVLGFGEGRKVGENAVARTSIMNFVQFLALVEDQELIKNDKQREFLILKQEVEKAAELPNDLMQMDALAIGLADIDFK